MNDWENALDALEEWVRQTVEDLVGAQPNRPPAPPPLPPGLVPEQLRLRSQVLVSTIHEAETAIMKRREQLRREEAYGAATRAG